ncbi:phosphotransferase enzyme family protein [Bacillus suaedae]|uniref:Phosphotransferase n=1 Tax=Halalkalibacter suaedae TaxID=2822140 RepID=A0A940WYA7_9BACI|nr:phosphotransferase [Bacillus suaedae]MBP3952987.1 phosphotransferase [Bacillus suaedae]
MEETVSALFSKDILHEAAGYFSLEIASLKEVGSFENYVFEAIQDGKPVILRLTHSSHRSQEQIESELDWLLYLHNHNAPVCPPYRSKNNKYIEQVQAGSTYFYVSLFKKASGTVTKLTNESYNQNLAYDWGEATSLLHRLTKEYQCPEHIQKRPLLIDEFQQQFVPFIPQDMLLLEKVNSVLKEIKQLSRETGFGLIHSDIHSGNFFYDGEQLSIFDFDDCSYHHFAHDLAMPLYYTLWSSTFNTEEDKESFAKQFLEDFINGYQTQCPVSSEMYSQINLFLKLRDCELYGVFHKKLDMSSLTTKQEQLLSSIRERILTGNPIVTI